jgi:hypothetical protein
MEAAWQTHGRLRCWSEREGFEAGFVAGLAAAREDNSVIPSSPTPEQVEAAAKAMWEGFEGQWEAFGRCYDWHIARQNKDGEDALSQARNALTAALSLSQSEPKP